MQIRKNLSLIFTVSQIILVKTQICPQRDIGVKISYLEISMPNEFMVRFFISFSNTKPVSQYETDKDISSIF